LVLRAPAANKKRSHWQLWDLMGPDREIDSDRLRAIFTPSGRLRRPNRMRFVELESSSASGRATMRNNAQLMSETPTADSCICISKSLLKPSE